MIFVDSNVLIDILGEEQEWRDWSIKNLSDLASDSNLVVNQIAFAEVAPGLGSTDIFRRWLASFEIGYVSIDEESSFTAGLAFRTYRNRRERIGGSVLPDFLIGGHAQTLGATILTRDPRFYRAYFPAVPLITPSKDEA
jgi:predicted nucleic acid-binding protein